MVIPNVMWKYEWHQKTAASLYLLAAFADNSLDKGEYFLQVLKMRGSVFPVSYTHLDVYKRQVVKEESH